MRQSARYPSSRRQAVASSDEDSIDGLESPPIHNSKQQGMRRIGGLSEEEGHYPASPKPVQSRYDNPYSDYSDESAASGSEDDDWPQQKKQTSSGRRSSRPSFNVHEQRLLALGRSKTRRSSASSQGEGGGSGPADLRRTSRSGSMALAPLDATSSSSPPNAHPRRRLDKGCIATIVIVGSAALAFFGYVLSILIKLAMAGRLG